MMVLGLEDTLVAWQLDSCPVSEGQTALAIKKMATDIPNAACKCGTLTANACKGFAEKEIPSKKGSVDVPKAAIKAALSTNEGMAKLPAKAKYKAPHGKSPFKIPIKACPAIEDRFSILQTGAAHC